MEKGNVNNASECGKSTQLIRVGKNVVLVIETAITPERNALLVPRIPLVPFMRQRRLEDCPSKSLSALLEVLGLKYLEMAMVTGFLLSMSVK